MRQSRTWLLCLLLLAGIALRMASFSWNTRLQGDVTLFAITAREYVDHDRLFYPMKWEYSDHVPYRTLASPASQHPLLWPFAAGLLGKLFKTEDTFTLLKLLGELVGISLLALVAWVGWRARQRTATLAALGLLALSPVLVDYSANGSSYIASAMLLVLASLLMMRFRDSQLTDYALAGLLCGIALQVHSVMGLLPLAFLIFWWRTLHHVLWRGIGVAGLTGLATLALWILWNLHYFGVPFYSYSTYHFLKQFGLQEVVVTGGVVTARSLASPASAAFIHTYLHTVGITALTFIRDWNSEVGPFCLALLLAGWIGLFRSHRRAAMATFLPFSLYTLTVFVWATSRDRFVVPIIPLTYLVAAAGFAILVRSRKPWRTLGWMLLTGAIVWSVAGFRDQPPTRYYKDDADWAAGYAKMLPLARELNDMERGVVLGRSYILDGGMETVYWQHQPFVYGRELPTDALDKVVEDFGVRYVWSGPHTHDDIATRFPNAHEILSNDLFHVFELPSYTLVPLSPELQAGAAQSGEESDPGMLAALEANSVKPIHQSVWLGNHIRLIGSAASQWDEDLLVDLAWVTTTPNPGPLQYFVHVIDAQGNLLAQYDGPLGRWPGDAESAWTEGNLLRQRVRLRLPAWTGEGSYDIFVGLYHPLTGERLALSVNSEAVSGNRYLLTPGQ